MVVTAGELRKGVKLEIDGEPYLVVDFEFSKPGKGQALYRCRLRNMITGTQFDRTYRSGDKFNAADPIVTTPTALKTPNVLSIVGLLRPHWKAMTVAMVCAGLLAAGIIWMGPETRGRQFTAADAA
jgi:hypothetical protein